jgi:hypothetical protein
MSRKLARRQLTPGKLVIATHNKGKLKEMQDLLAPLAWSACRRASWVWPNRKKPARPSSKTR